MEKRKKRKHRNKNIYIYSIFAIMIGIIISSAIYQTQFSPEKEKLPAEDYFEIRDAIVIDANWQKSTDEVLFITQIRFNLTAVGGDTHSILIYGRGMSSQEDWPYLSELKQNETRDITLPTGYPSPRSVASRMRPDGKFPFDIKIDSAEASGYITILF